MLRNTNHTKIWSGMLLSVAVWLGIGCGSLTCAQTVTTTTPQSKSPADGTPRERVNGNPVALEKMSLDKAASNGAALGASEALLGLLPEVDVVGVLDARRVFVDLLPRLKQISTGGIGKTASEVETFARLGGIDPAQIQAAVLGVKLTESLGRGTGVLLLQGVSVDIARIREVTRATGGTLQVTDTQGKQLYTLTGKANAEGVTPAPVHFALLENDRLVVGDLTAVQAVVAGSVAPATTQAALTKALREVKSNGLVRFAGNLPASLRKMMTDQGELFAQMSQVKTIFGSFDLRADDSALLEAWLRTASANDAAALRDSLSGLMFLAKAFLSTDDSPTMQVATQMLDQVKISLAAQDVALTLAIPKEAMSKLTK